MSKFKPGLLENQDYFTQLCYSIIDTTNDHFYYEGNEHGVHLTINGQSTFIPNEADEEKEIEKLWKQAKKKSKKSSVKDSPSTSE